MNMYDISKYVEKETGIAFIIYGFDSGVGLYKPVDYRDHPEAFTEGDYPLIDKDLLAQNTDGSVELIIGNVQKTVPGFVEKLSPDAPLAFFSVDVDYYSFAAGCLKILMGDPECYLPHFWCYFDDIALASANHWCDELLAIEEFNHANKLRKIDKSDMLKTYRVFKLCDWLERMRTVHVLDHPARQVTEIVSRDIKRMANAALGIYKTSRD